VAELELGKFKAQVIPPQDSSKPHPVHAWGHFHIALFWQTHPLHTALLLLEKWHETSWQGEQLDNTPFY
jgi:hypothetical protein